MTLLNSTVYRKKLMEISGQEPCNRILYVQAPAGCGKTVFAEQWLEAQEAPKAAIALDEYDNSIQGLCCKLKSLLFSLYKEKSEAALLTYLRHPDFNKAPAEFLMRAASMLPADSRGAVVIDDLHYLSDPQAQRALRIFLKRLPFGIKVCMLSRNMPSEFLSALYLKNELKLILQEQMLFDTDEIRALYKRKNIILTKKQAEEVLAFTEGWPIGVNALLLSRSKCLAETITQGWLECFLKSQVWKMWDERLKEFMVATCIEDKLTEGLCSALTGEEDSKMLLSQLTEEGAFLSRQHDGSFRFHRLFRDFLRKQFDERPKTYQIEKIRASGKWYQAQNDFYHAVERFSAIKDYDNIAGCFDYLEDMERSGFDTEMVMHAVHNALDEEIVKRYPYLYFMMAFTARNEGRTEDFIRYADLYYANYKRIAARNPETAHNIFFLYVMDFRVTLQHIVKMAEGWEASDSFQGVRGSATLYFPLYHRSYRDFSEILPGNIDEGLEAPGRILGPLVGEEYEMVLECIRSGLYYERGDLEHAQKIALFAVSKMQSRFAPETKFCAQMLLLTISHALQQREEEKILEKEIQEMIETDKAFYLQRNFDAVIYRNRLDLKDTKAARQWMEIWGAEPGERLDFLGLYGYFTTARAYLTLGNFNKAIILLEKILALCKTLRRPIDVIEAEILLAITYRKKHRGNNKAALPYLKAAVLTAQPLGYEQAFINEGAELEKMLTSLKNWIIRSDYSGKLSEVFVRKLYIGVAGKADSGKEAVCGRDNRSIKLTERQKQIAKLICEGYSYRKIGDELGIQFSTVRSHIELIYRKLDVSDMKEAILKIKQLHLLEDV